MTEQRRVRTPSSRRRSRPFKHDQEEEQLDGGDAQYFVHPGSSSANENADASKRRLGKRKRDYAQSKKDVRNSEPFLFFQAMLLNLISDSNCEDFLKPVLEMWEPQHVPGYLERIRTPMDLGTVKERLKGDNYLIKEAANFYFDQEACAKDIRLIFENCMLYNDPASDLHKLASELLNNVNLQITNRENDQLREQDSAIKRAKRESERRRRKQAEEEAIYAAEEARRSAIALELVKKDAEETEKKRLAEMKRKELEWKQRLEREKKEAVDLAVEQALKKQQVEELNRQQAMLQQRREGERPSRFLNTSSVSSDEQDGGNGEMTFAFVSTHGMEKKRGRKSAVVMELEQRHDDLMKRRKALVDDCAELARLKQIEMTYDEKQKLCDEVAELDFVRMKAVADIISKGLNRPDILNEVEIDMDVNSLDNKVLREIQFFLSSPVSATAKDALRDVERGITEIEGRLVQIRYQKIGS